MCQYSSGRLTRLRAQSTPNAKHPGMSAPASNTALARRRNHFPIAAFPHPAPFTLNSYPESCLLINRTNGTSRIRQDVKSGTQVAGVPIVCVTPLVHFNNLLISDVTKTPPRSELYSQGKYICTEFNPISTNYSYTYISISSIRGQLILNLVQYIQYSCSQEQIFFLTGI